jgi:hypothetical protein
LPVLKTAILHSLLLEDLSSVGLNHTADLPDVQCLSHIM